MNKKLQRVFRERHLTPEEAAADRKLRETLNKEFPPSSVPSPTRASPLSELLKQSIRDSRKTIDEIAAEAGVSPLLISQFLSGERDIRLATADKLTHTLGLEVTAQ
jgi:transcriptional regulator with XRE-family HTH domain